MLRNNDGFDIIINGVDRTFRDVRANAYDAARVLKGNHKGDIVEIRDRSRMAARVR